MALSGGKTRPIGARVRVAAAALMLAACAAPARETFDFDGPGATTQRIAIKTAAPLAVGEPSAAGPVASDRVVVRESDESLAVLPGAQWADRLPRLFQRRVIEFLERAGVAAALPGASAANQLQLDLRRFEIDVARNLAVVEVAARLAGDAGGKPRAAAVFSTHMPAPEHTGAPAIRALSDAADETARKIARWARERL